MPPLETLPPRDPSGGVFYLRIVLSPEEASHPWVIRNHFFLHGEELLVSRPTPKLEDPPLSAVRDCLFNLSTATPILETVPPSATWGRAMPWWQGPTHMGSCCLFYKIKKTVNRHLLHFYSCLRAEYCKLQLSLFLKQVLYLHCNTFCILGLVLWSPMKWNSTV